jgi:hypothetical protein
VSEWSLSTTTICSDSRVHRRSHALLTATASRGREVRPLHGARGVLHGDRAVAVDVEAGEEGVAAGEFEARDGVVLVEVVAGEEVVEAGERQLGARRRHRALELLQVELAVAVLPNAWRAGKCSARAR